MDRIKKLAELVRPFYGTDDPAHDWPHIGRVAATARKLAEGQDVQLECILAGVYCHDLVNLPKNHPDRSRASELAADKAGPILKECGFDADEIVLIRSCIIEHSFSRGLNPSSTESAIVQDSDRLDSLGAIGILRCASVNTIMRSKYYDPFDPFAENRELDDKRFMIDHYFVKLFQLPELMVTEAGKKEGYARVEFMRGFLSILRNEIK